MTPEQRHERLQELFHACADLSGEGRVAYLEKHCTDPDLRQEVKALVATHEARTSSLIDSTIPHGDILRQRNGDSAGLIGKRIGNFFIRGVIASGGMGTVYEAKQESLHRQVALKVMKHGINSEMALRRFDYESKLLARLRHPGIAQVLEAGVHNCTGDPGHESSVPYFAMEYVSGAKPITEYARAKRLTVRERLRLFANVCDAMHHAHQKGIIHRDLKPSNILVDFSGAPKIIDFGVAHAPDAEAMTVACRVGELIGTLQYMSPEQYDADPGALDARSDVYSLGVVLYELLCDQSPYDLTNKGVYEAVRLVRDTEPMKPSMRVSTGDASRSGGTLALRGLRCESPLVRELKGEVDWIVMKCLEKDRNRRYSSASEIALDIGRYFRGEPVAAGPPSALYRTRKLLARNLQIAVATAAVIVAFMVGNQVVIAGWLTSGVLFGLLGGIALLSALWTYRWMRISRELHAEVWSLRSRLAAYRRLLPRGVRTSGLVLILLLCGLIIAVQTGRWVESQYDAVTSPIDEQRTSPEAMVEDEEEEALAP